MLKYTVGIIVMIWLARYLGPERYGVYSFAIAFTALFGALASLGLNNIVVRELVNHPEKKNELLGSTFIMMITSGFVAVLITTTAIFLMRPEDTLSILMVFIISLSYVFFSFRSIIYYFESRVESKYVVIGTNSAFIISSIVKVFLILTNQGLIPFALVALLEAVLIAVALVVIFYKQGHSILNWNWDRETAVSLLKDSYPLMFSGIMIVIFMKIDQVMLRQMVSDTEAGLYAAAVQISEIWFFIPIIIKVSIFPNINNSSTDEELYKKMEDLFKVMVIFSLIIIIPTSLFSSQIVNLLFGLDYIKTGPILAISIWTLLFTSLGIAKGAFIITKNYVKQSFYFTTIGAVVNVSLNFFLLPKYGGIGAAIATIISVAISVYFSNFLFPPLFKLGKIMTRTLFLTNMIKR